MRFRRSKPRMGATEREPPRSLYESCRHEFFYGVKAFIDLDFELLSILTSFWTLSM